MDNTENVYFNMAKETMASALWENIQSVYEKQSSSSKLMLIRQLFNMKMREREIWQLPTLTPSVGCYPKSPPKGSISKKRRKPLPYSRAYRWLGRYFVRHSPIISRSLTWTKQSSKSSQRTFGRNRWDSPSTNQHKPTTWPSRLIRSMARENKPREPIETQVDWDMGIVDQCFLHPLQKN